MGLNLVKIFSKEEFNWDYLKILSRKIIDSKSERKETYLFYILLDKIINEGKSFFLFSNEEKNFFKKELEFMNEENFLKWINEEEKKI